MTPNSMASIVCFYMNTVESVLNHPSCISTYYFATQQYFIAYNEYKLCGRLPH
jgi:hypothetical protein